MYYDVFNIKYEFWELCCLRFSKWLIFTCAHFSLFRSLERTLYISSAVIAFDTNLQVFCLKGQERRTGKSGVGCGRLVKREVGWGGGYLMRCFTITRRSVLSWIGFRCLKGTVTPNFFTWFLY